MPKYLISNKVCLAPIKKRHSYIKCLNGCAKVKKKSKGILHINTNGSLANKSIMGKHNNLKFYSKAIY